VSQTTSSRTFIKFPAPNHRSGQKRGKRIFLFAVIPPIAPTIFLAIQLLTLTQAMFAAETPQDGQALASSSVDLLGLSHVAFDRDYAMQRFLNPLGRDDMHRDLPQTFCRPRAIVCRCGASIASIKARYRARLRARSKARMRVLLRRLQRKLKRKSPTS